MKILNRTKPTEPAAQEGRGHTSLHLTPTSHVAEPPRRSPPPAVKARPANGIKVKSKIETFYHAAPAAKSVQLLGDFTHWQQQPINLRKGSNGLWWTAVRLEPGTHYYRFLVDGQWHDDPECPLYAPNPFGSKNAVRQVN